LGGPVLIGDLAEQEAIPKKFLENILLSLKHRGLVHSRKGPHGGYQLGRDGQ
jgi:Rrf2 family protein